METQRNQTKSRKKDIGKNNERRQKYTQKEREREIRKDKLLLWLKLILNHFHKKRTEITNQAIQKIVSNNSPLFPQILEMKTILAEMKMLIKILENKVVEIY